MPVIFCGIYFKFRHCQKLLYQRPQTWKVEKHKENLRLKSVDHWLIGQEITKDTVLLIKNIFHCLFTGTVNKLCV